MFRVFSGKNNLTKREEIVAEDTLLHAEHVNIVFRDLLKRKHFFTYEHPGLFSGHHWRLILDKKKYEIWFNF